VIAVLADWLGRHVPALYRVVRPPWRALARRVRGPSYWEARRHFRYYEEVVRLARLHVPSGGRLIDVGADDTDVLQRLDWFEERVALDRHYYPPRPGIETITMDFMDYQPSSEFDLVVCLQVVEHVTEPAAFARKLLESGRTTIISVPYRWADARLKAHLHDPVDEAKLESWTGRKPISSCVVADPRERLIAVYQRAEPPPGR
jgi:hypothetical protein